MNTCMGIGCVQVASLEDVKAHGLIGSQTPHSFLEALAATEAEEPFYNSSSLVDLEVLFKFLEEVQLYLDKRKLQMCCKFVFGAEVL